MAATDAHRLTGTADADLDALRGPSSRSPDRVAHDSGQRGRLRPCRVALDRWTRWTSPASTTCSAPTRRRARVGAHAVRREVAPVRRRTGSRTARLDDPRGLAKRARRARPARHAPGGLRLRGHERGRLRPRLPGAGGGRLRHPLAGVGAGLARDVRDPRATAPRSRSSSGCRGWPPARRSAASASPSPTTAPTPRGMRTRAPPGRRRLGARRPQDVDHQRLGRRRRRRVGADRRAASAASSCRPTPRLHRAGDQAQDVAAGVGHQRARPRRRAAARRRGAAGGPRAQGPAVLPHRGAVRDRLGLHGRRALGFETARAVRRRARAVRPADRRLPAHPGQARRHGARARQGPAARPPPRPAQGRRHRCGPSRSASASSTTSARRSRSAGPRGRSSAPTGSRSSTR